MFTKLFLVYGVLAAGFMAAGAGTVLVYEDYIRNQPATPVAECVDQHTTQCLDHFGGRRAPECFDVAQKLCTMKLPPIRVPYRDDQGR
jgi:hypothetical protein